MSVVPLRLGLLLAVGALVLAAAPAERADAAPPSAAPLVVDAAAAGTVADTLRAAVQAGQTLVVALPGDYETVRAPALSWLVDRSFMWRTLAQERGTLPVLFRRRGAPADTLVLLVEIRP